MKRGSLQPSVWLLLALCVPAFLPLAAPGYFLKAHDARHSVFFLVEFHQAIQDGVLWPVWGPDHAVGFGYPLWLLYAPLAYFIAEGFHLLGFGYTAAIKLTWLACFLFGALGMYRLARRWWGPAPALVAAVAYTYAPYHLLQIYVRSSLAEFAALSLFPWVLLAFDRLCESPGPRRAATAALSFGALLLTHTVSTLIFVPLLGGFLLVRVASRWRWTRAPQAAPVEPPDGQDKGKASWPIVLWSACALALGVLLAAVFLLPMLFERRYIVEAQWVQATYNYSNHFVYPSQFFDPDWGYGYSVPGAEDGMSFQIGLVLFVAAVIGAIAVVRAHPGQLPRRLEALFLGAAGVVALFSMMPVAKPVWDLLPLVSLVQFPWRLLAVVVVAFPLLAAAGVHWLQRGEAAGSRAGPYAYGLALVLVLASLPYTQFESVPVSPEDESPTAVIDFELDFPDMRGMTVWSQRMPANEDSPLIAQYLAGEPLARAAIADGQGAVLEQRSGAASSYARVRAENDVRLRFYTYFFPGWRAVVDGKPADISIEPPLGLINVHLPPGEHEVQLRFGATPLRRLAASVSFLALAITAGLWLARRKHA